MQVRPKRIVIDWDWGAAGIWIVLTPEERTAPGLGARLTAGGAPKDRHAAWRGLLSDELIDALQAWNDRRDEVMGIDGHHHSDEERVAFWARSRELATLV
jgi:hypothetical protein